MEEDDDNDDDDDDLCDIMSFFKELSEDRSQR
jgi:hypothetical protein